MPAHDTTTPQLAATVDDDLISAMWFLQVPLYPALGIPGITYHRGYYLGRPVDCLLYRGDTGRLHGVLNHYSVEFPGLEKPGNVNLWVDPACRRQGIGRALLAEADRRWQVEFAQQMYTRGGLALVRVYLRTRRGADGARG